MRYSVWTSVKVINMDHPRADQVGTIFANSEDRPDETAVKFEGYGETVTVAVPVADLAPL